MYIGTPLRRALWLLFGACTILFIASPKAGAQAGQLDPSFGHGGIVTTDFGHRFVNDLAAAFAVAIQTDGKIVVCGSTPTAIGAPLATLARYNTNGGLDTSFGTNGIVTTSNVALPSAMVVQTNGDIVVAGSIVFRGDSKTMNVMRYSPGGILDTTFGTGGIVTLSNDQGAATSALALQPNGDLLYANGFLLFFGSCQTASLIPASGVMDKLRSPARTPLGGRCSRVERFW